MAATAVREGGAAAPPDLDAIVDRLLEHHGLPPRPMIRRLGWPAQRCRCDHPIGIRELWHGPAWARCLLCGRDLESDR